jgi:peptide/nickel transport system substrate-binding protein
MSTGSEPAAGFDPIMGWGCGEHVHEPLIQSTLITTNQEMEFVNDLATGYSASDDGLTWSFTIRDDIEFSDGSPLTAADVAFTINSLVASTGSTADLTMVDSAVALDPTHIEIRLNKPYNALLYTLAVVGIVPEAGYDANYGSQPIGSGRYLLEHWDPGQQAIFVANPGYYGSAPSMERVVVLFMAEDAALAGVRSGQVDIAYTSAIYADQQIEGCELVSFASVDSRGISLPTVGNKVTADLAIRRAMNYALDRQTMVSNVLAGHGSVAYSVADGMPWASPDMHVPFDRELAEQLLAEAGWVAGSQGTLEREGTAAEIDLYYPANDSTRQALAFEFANQLATIGIKVNPLGKSWDEIYLHQYSDPVLWGWGSNSPSETYNLLHSQGWGNFASYENPAVDAHLDAALANPVLEDSFAEWQAAHWDGTDGVGVQGGATWVWLANIDHLYFARTGLRVADQKPHPHGHGWSLVNNVDAWTWDQLPA